MESIRAKFSEKMESAKTAVSNAIDRIVPFIPNTVGLVMIPPVLYHSTPNDGTDGGFRLNKAINQNVNAFIEVHNYIDGDEVASRTTEKVSDNLAIAQKTEVRT